MINSFLFNKKLWTIVIACYNSFKTICRTLDSLDLDRNRDVVVFVVDDGGSDNLQVTIDKYLKKYPKNIKLFRKGNGNWGSVVNFAIKKANSHYFSILDSDDTFNTESFNKITQIMRKRPKRADVLRVNYSFYHEDEDRHEYKKVSTIKEDIKFVDFEDLSLFHMFTIHSCVFSLKLLKTIKPLPEKIYYSDNCLIYQAILRCRTIGFINKNIMLYEYHINHGEQTISMARTIKNFDHLKIVYKFLLDQELPKNVSKRRKLFCSKMIKLLVYWMTYVLSQDPHLTEIRKKAIIAQMFAWLKEYDEKYDFGYLLSNSLLPLIKNFSRTTLSLFSLFSKMITTGAIGASRYDKFSRKEAKIFKKISQKKYKESKKKIKRESK